ncbi:helix-turn-helix domain-containing protein [Corynebacterium sp. S7]
MEPEKQTHPVIIPTGSVILTQQDAAGMAEIVLASADMAARQGMRVNPRLLQLAAQIKSANGTTEQPAETPEYTIQYEQIDTTEAANILGCSDRYARKLADTGRIPGTRNGGRWFFNREDVETYRDFR